MAAAEPRVLPLVGLGMPLADIATTLGQPASKVRSLLRTEASRASSGALPLAGQVTVEVARCDALLSALMPKALAGDVRAATEARMLSAHRMTLLGFDAKRQGAKQDAEKAPGASAVDELRKARERRRAQ